MKAHNARTSRRTTMKKFRAAFAVLTIVLMTCAGVRAQKLAPKPTPLTTAPDLSKLNIEKILEQLQTPNVQASAQEASPLQVVADFLQLQPGSGERAGSTASGAPGNTCTAPPNSAS